MSLTYFPNICRGRGSVMNTPLDTRARRWCYRWCKCPRQKPTEILQTKKQKPEASRQSIDKSGDPVKNNKIKWLNSFPFLGLSMYNQHYQLMLKLKHNNIGWLISQTCEWDGSTFQTRSIKTTTIYNICLW